jgi:hypothetical protein
MPPKAKGNGNSNDGTPDQTGEQMGIGERIAARLLERRRSLSPAGAHAIATTSDYKEWEGSGDGKGNTNTPSATRVALADVLSKANSNDIDHLRSVLRALDQTSKPAATTPVTAAAAATPVTSSSSSSPASATPGIVGPDLPLATQQLLNRINDSKGLIQLPPSLSPQQPFVPPGGAPTALPLVQSNMIDNGMCNRVDLFESNGGSMLAAGGERQAQQIPDLICGDIYVPGAQRWAPGEIARTQHHYRSFRARSTFIRCKDLQRRYEVENLSLLIDLMTMNRTDVALEMAVRRLAGVEEADAKGDWSLASYLNGNFAQPHTIGSDALRKQAYKDMAAQRTAHVNGNSSSGRHNNKGKGGKSKEKSGGSGAKGATATTK